jgi:hypothetical protein
MMDYWMNCDNSIFERIASRDPVKVNTAKDSKANVTMQTYIDRGGKSPGDDYGLTYSMFMVLNSLCLIPNFYLTPDQKAILTQKDVVDTASSIGSYIESLRIVHKIANKPKRDAAKKVASKASRDRRVAKAKGASPQQSLIPPSFNLFGPK